MVWDERDLEDHLVPTPCHGQGHLPLDQVAQSSVEGKDNLPRPAGHTLLDAPHDPIGFLGSQGTLLAHG